MRYTLNDYDYHLPDGCIAQQPLGDRDQSKLLVLGRQSGAISHDRFPALETLLSPGDVLVVNNTQVIPARLVGNKESGGRIEVLVLNAAPDLRSIQDNNRFDCILKASKKPRIGTILYFSEGLTGRIEAKNNENYQLSFSSQEDFISVLDRIGQTPLPPYIKREKNQSSDTDRKTYQTVYATQKGAIAAPTAGFHFSADLLRRLKKKGVLVTEITLHVGIGTFSPVRANDIRHHQMHSEWFSIPKKTADIVTRAKQQGQRVIAVGTTSVRTLEFAAQTDGKLSAMTGSCDLFIFPGYQFRVVGAMITNFHLPKSTLIMLVSAFAGRKKILTAYQAAIQEGYRFYSYGDAMFIY